MQSSCSQPVVHVPLVDLQPRSILPLIRWLVKRGAWSPRTPELFGCSCMHFFMPPAKLRRNAGSCNPTTSELLGSMHCFLTSHVSANSPLRGENAAIRGLHCLAWAAHLACPDITVMSLQGCEIQKRENQWCRAIVSNESLNLLPSKIYEPPSLDH